MYALGAELFLREYKKEKEKEKRKKEKKKKKKKKKKKFKGWLHNLCSLLFSLHINTRCCDCVYCFPGCIMRKFKHESEWLPVGNHSTFFRSSQNCLFVLSRDFLSPLFLSLFLSFSLFLSLSH